MVDLLETLHEAIQSGLTWATGLSVVLLILKWREGRIKAKQRQRMEADIRAIAEHLGVQPCVNTSIPITTRLTRLVGAGSISSWVGGLTAQCAKKSMNSHLRRMNMLNNIHIRNGGAVVIGLLVTYLNQRFGWNLDANAIVTLWGLILAFISREVYLNIRKFSESLLTNVAQSAKEAAVTTSGEPIETLLPKPMTQEEATAVLKELSDLLTPIYDSVKSGRKTEATDQLLTAAVAIRDYLKKVG